jgi:hypothetical protein
VCKKVEWLISSLLTACVMGDARLHIWRVM